MCCTSSLCTVFKIVENSDVVNTIQEEIQNMYYVDSPKCPSKMSESLKIMKHSKQGVSKSAIFLGEFPSIKGYYGNTETDTNRNDTTAYIEPTKQEIHTGCGYS